VIAVLAAALVLAAVAPPVPSPSPPPTILHLRVSPVCSTLHNLVLPLAQVNQGNVTLLNQIGGDETKYLKYYSDRFGGGRVLYAAQIDQTATNMLPHLQEMDELLKQSYGSIPQGRNPQVDALRQRAQNIVDVERAIANRYIETFGAVVDSYGQALLPPELDHSISTVPSGYGVRDLKYSRFGSLQTTLQSEGQALIPQALAAAKDCDGV